MRRYLQKRLLLFCLIALAAPLFPQAADQPNSFDQEKFEQWQKQGPREQIPWKIRLLPTGLSFFQRLAAHIEIEADADHILKHSKTGRVVAMIQLTDSKGDSYRNDGKIELSEMKEVRNSNAIFSWNAFVLPGQYAVDLALYDTQSGEHDFARQRLRIPPLKSDPLPALWQDLPAVEFWAPNDSKDTDNLFHPDIDGKLKLQIATARPVRIELLADFTPSEVFGGSHTSYMHYLSGVVPTLKIFSQMELTNGTLEVDTLNLKDRKVTFEEEVTAQKNADANDQNEAALKGLDWPRLKNTLKANDPGTVNVRVLQDRHPTPIFLRDELLRRIAAGIGKPAPDKSSLLRVYILLSGPLDSYSFNGSEFNAIPESLPEQCACLIYYLEYDLFWGRSGVFNTVGKVEKMLKPFKLRTFSISSASDARRALAIMLEEIIKAGSN
ncbi:MAG TPA: hypothetical protein VG649_08495 [Candidatus Angelobacter sp.]|jgi:hypothetical protein|nr:hypothetical protein [Candidatus Angelobacter sp.]